MAKVSDLKDRALAFERRGQIEKALTVYQHIIKHLEGTPAIVPELQLYVKAGDLLLKLEDPEAGLAMYERAAEQLAAHGSAKSVIALCAKILGVASERTDVHLRYARQMVKAGHVTKAGDVLIDYAERAELDEMLQALEQLQGRSDDEARSDLERLLKLAELGEPAATEVAGESVSAEPAPPVTEPEEPAPTVTEPEEPAPTFGAPEEWGPTFAEPEEPAPTFAAPEETAPTFAAPEETAPTLEPTEPVGVGVGVGVTKERKRPAALWLGVAAAGIVIVGGAGLFLSGVIGGGSTTDEPPGDVASPLAVPAGDASAALEGDSTVLIASLADAGAADTAVPPIARRLSPSPTVPRRMPPPVTEPATTVAPSPGVRRQVVVVDGLEVEGVTQFSSDGRTAYRVIHVLDSGERLTLTSVAGAPANTGEARQIRVSTMPGDTAVGTVRFGRYTVNARGRVRGAILEVLLGRLVVATVTVRPSSN